MYRFHIFLLCSLLYSQVQAQDSFFATLADSTLTLTQSEVQYDPSYFSMDYPNGDVPANKGVCTDVVIRAYRKMGVDLQKEVHEDMKNDFAAYPKNWGLSYTDKNIDHRRVPNLMTYFKRQGAELDLSNDPNDYLPGDVVCWSLGGGLTHIGIVVNEQSADKRRFMIVHNIGSGQVVEDCLLSYKIIGHYRFKK